MFLLIYQVSDLLVSEERMENCGSMTLGSSTHDPILGSKSNAQGIYRLREKVMRHLESVMSFTFLVDAAVMDVCWLIYMLSKLDVFAFT